MPYRLNIIILQANSGAQVRLILFLLTPGDDFESSLLSFEKLDRASPDLWPEQRKITSSLHSPPSLTLAHPQCFHALCYPFAVPGVAEFAASYRSVSWIHLGFQQACVPQNPILYFKDVCLFVFPNCSPSRIRRPNGWQIWRVKTLKC